MGFKILMNPSKPGVSMASGHYFPDCLTGFRVCDEQRDSGIERRGSPDERVPQCAGALSI
jgi:hypothetical protein